MTKKELKEALVGFTKNQLTDLILDLYRIKEVKVQLENRFMDEGALKKRDRELFEKAYESVYKAFHPRRHIAQGCVSKSTKAINDFKKASNDLDLLAELLMYQIELISKFSGSIERELYYNSMYNTTERNVKFLVKNGYVKQFLPRLKTASKDFGGDWDYNLI